MQPDAEQQAIGDRRVNVSLSAGDVAAVAAHGDISRYDGWFCDDRKRRATGRRRRRLGRGRQRKVKQRQLDRLTR